MDAVFLKVFNISVTACWLCLAVVLLRFCLKRAPKGLICLLWAVVGLRLIFPFSLESVFSLIPSTETVPESIISGGTPPTANIGAPNVNIGTPNVNVGAPNVNGTVTPSAPVVTPPTAEPVDLMQVAVTVASYVWIAGVVLMLCYMAFSYLRVRLRVREAVPTEKGVWICDGVDTPFILGIVRPRIYLPSDLEEGDRKFVLAHERAHLRRWDHAWKPLGFLLLAVYWFQPLLWVAYVLLCRDIEFACDEKVLAEMGQDARRAYSNALVKCSVLRKQISACPVAFGETNVVSRVKRVMHYKKPGFWIVLIAVIAVIVTAVCFLTDPVSDREDDDPTEQETTGQETTGVGEETTETGTGDMPKVTYERFHTLLEDSYHSKKELIADYYAQHTAMSAMFALSVKMDNGRVFLNGDLYDRLIYDENFQVKFSQGLRNTWLYDDSEVSRANVMKTMDIMEGQKGCYLLVREDTNLGHQFVAVYEIDGILYFITFFDNDNKEVARIHSAVIEITPEKEESDIVSQYGTIPAEVVAEMRAAYLEKPSSVDPSDLCFRLVLVSDDTYVLFVDGPFDHILVETLETIGLYQFWYPSSQTMYAYRDGTFCHLSEAYAWQWLDHEDLGLIHERYLDVLGCGHIQLPESFTPVTGSISSWEAKNSPWTMSCDYRPRLDVIGSYEQWQAYCLAYGPSMVSLYNSDYFNTHSLVIYSRREVSCSIEVCVQNVQIRDGKLVVTLGRYEPLFQDQALKPWCILIEIEGDVLLDENSDAVLETVMLSENPATRPAKVEKVYQNMPFTGGTKELFSDRASFAAWLTEWTAKSFNTLSGASELFDEAFFETHALLVIGLDGSVSEWNHQVSQINWEDGKIAVTFTYSCGSARDDLLFEHLYMISILKAVIAEPVTEITVTSIDLLADAPNTPVTGSVTGFHTWTSNSLAYHIDHQPTAFVICSYERWEAYCAFYTDNSDLLSKYDSNYFQSHALVVYCKSEGSGSITASVQNVQVENERLVVTVQRNVPAFGTDDVKHWSIFIEIEGDVSLDEDSDVTITLVEKTTGSD